MQRTLYLMRHCEASHHGIGGDKRRPLTQDGRADAALIGHHLTGAGIQQVLVSSATRTLQTASQLGLGVTTDSLDSLYNGGMVSILRCVRELPDAVGAALVVGHFPGIPTTVSALCDDTDSDPDALESLKHGFGSGTIARLEFDGDWADLEEARLTAVWHPSDL